MSRTVLEARGLTRTYPTGHGVRDVTFQLAEGEILGLLGPNGAGKTTTIRVLTTLLCPTSGSFSVLDRSQDEPEGIRRLIGVLPESSGYNLVQTGRELLVYHARLHGLDQERAQGVAQDLLRDVGLQDRADSLVRTYSRGMRQRLGIARALVNAPRLVFLDEPTLGLDPVGQRDLIELIGRVARERRASVVLSTHLLAEAEEICDRALILNHGRVVANGTIADIRGLAAAPRTLRVSVSPQDHDRAARVLQSVGEVVIVSTAERSGAFVVTLAKDAPVGGVPGTGVFMALQGSGIPILRYDVDAVRLSDAFLHLTKETNA